MRAIKRPRRAFPPSPAQIASRAEVNLTVISALRPALFEWRACCLLTDGRRTSHLRAREQPTSRQGLSVTKAMSHRNSLNAAAGIRLRT